MCFSLLLHMLLTIRHCQVVFSIIRQILAEFTVNDFDKLDKNKDGVLDKTEFDNDEEFDHIDRNADGKVSESEYTRAYGNKRVSFNALHAVFDKLGVPHHGTLREDLLELFEIRDNKSNGLHSELNQIEFVTVVLALTVRARSQQMGRVRTPAERLQSITQCQPFGEKMEREDVASIVRSLLSMREVLMIGGTTAAQAEWGFTYSAEGTVTLSARQRTKHRIVALHQTFPEYSELTTLRELLDAEATRITANIFREAGFSHQKWLPQTALISWAEKESVTAIQTLGDVI